MTRRGWIAGVTVALGLMMPAGAQAVVLVDQFPQGSFTVPIVYSFERGDGLDSVGADDFTVPDGRAYTVQSVDVIGRALSGTGTGSARVRIHADAGGSPGAELFAQNVTTLSPATCQATMNCNFSAPIAGAPALGPGSYWISVQSTGDYLWAWAVTPPQAPLGAPAHWQNPGNLSLRDCITWQTLATCEWTTPNDGTDLIYRLNGTAADSRFSFGQFSSQGRKLFLEGSFAAAGQLKLAGKGVKPSTKSMTAGTKDLRVKLKRSVQRKLNRGKKAKITVKGTFTATGGVPYVQSASVKLVPARAGVAPRPITP
jgi:hypothetical protein